ncbi:hypothetical protein GE061_005614 [Apolygus lucorum]|uniref:Uncharacterized protein n=1 Tax=Apolygus lucorum TaxID=248454 RepID=A0A6A4IPQ1_APOLU|nr:hypothetical protein GE061_005614 [Apolygus lucorum]
MDTQKLLNEQKMMAGAAAAGFCIPPTQNRKFLFEGISHGREIELKGLDYKKLLDEQQALEQAEAIGFCVPRNGLKSSLKKLPEWDSKDRRDSFGMSSRRTTATDYWRGSGDAPAGRSTTTVSRSNDEEDEEEEGCHRNLSDESFLLQDPFEPRLSKNTVRETLTSHPSIAGQTVPRSASTNTYRTEILSRVSTRVTNKLPSVSSTGPPSKPNQGGGTWLHWVLIIALMYGLVILLLAELYYQAYWRKTRSSRRARSSLVRLILDDLIYFVRRHFTV